VVDADHHFPALGVAQKLDRNGLAVRQGLLNDVVSMIEGKAAEIDA
jgi:hypothetical protein